MFCTLSILLSVFLDKQHTMVRHKTVVVYMTKQSVFRNSIPDNFYGQSELSIEQSCLIIRVMRYIRQLYPLISICFHSKKHKAYWACCQVCLSVLFKMSSVTQHRRGSFIFTIQRPSPFFSFVTSHHFSSHNLPLPQVTLQYLWEKEYQVLVFYHHPMALEVPFLWPGQMMPAPWANTTDPEKLVQFLQASVTDRRSASTFIPCGQTMSLMHEDGNWA